MKQAEHSIKQTEHSMKQTEHSMQQTEHSMKRAGYCVKRASDRLGGFCGGGRGGYGGERRVGERNGQVGCKPRRSIGA
eukprot:2337751-Rhodomonas_salina.1